MSLVLGPDPGRQKQVFAAPSVKAEHEDGTHGIEEDRTGVGKCIKETRHQVSLGLILCRNASKRWYKKFVCEVISLLDKQQRGTS